MTKSSPVENRSSRQAHRLLQAGVALFLCALLVGLAIPAFKLPRVGLSTHLLGIMQGMFLMILGLLWPRLKLGPATSWAGFWLLLYGCLAAWTANLLAGILGAGNSLLPIAAGSARGTPFQEMLIGLELRSAAVALIVAVVIVLWGLRSPAGAS